MAFIPSKLRGDAELELEKWMYDEALRRLPYVSQKSLKDTLRFLGFNVPGWRFRKWFVEFLRGNLEVVYAILTKSFLNFEELLESMKEGSIVIIVGERGSGKTDFSLTIAEKLINQGYRLITNIKIEEISYDYCDSTPDLKKLLKEKGEKLVIIDECGKWFTAYDSVFLQYLKMFKKEMTDVRKNQSIFIFILPHLEDLSAILRRESRFIVNKKNKTTAVLYGKEYPLPVILVNITPTNLKFDTFQKAEWKTEIKKKRKTIGTTLEDWS